jgi:hypothetical protein
MSTLANAITTVLTAERDEDPRPRLTDRDLIHLVREQLGVGNTDEIDDWGDLVTPAQAAAYKTVLTASRKQLDASL